MSDTNETLDDICARIRKIDESMMRDLDFMAVFLEFLPRDIEAAAEREREETKDYFAKLHDGPSMICTAKNCSLRNAAEDIVEQVKAEASFGHFAPVVVDDRPVGNAAATRKFDEAAFDAAVSKPNGWSDVADPVAEIRRMRDGDDPGNASALRSALESIDDDCRVLDRKDMWEEEGECYYDALRDIREKVSAALAAPARNCDRFATADEAEREYCRKAFFSGYEDPVIRAAFRWAFATKEGGYHA